MSALQVFLQVSLFFEAVMANNKNFLLATEVCTVVRGVSNGGQSTMSVVYLITSVYFKLDQDHGLRAVGESS